MMENKALRMGTYKGFEPRVIYGKNNRLICGFDV